jgi:hypothetical protein
LVRRSLPKKSRDAAFERAAADNDGTDLRRSAF